MHALWRPGRIGTAYKEPDEQIMLLSRQGAGTNETMRVTSKAETRAWRWQERRDGIRLAVPRWSRYAAFQ